MIDLHTHTTFSDGELIPSELVRRAEVLGYTAIGITDHVDYTNIEHVLTCVSKAKYLEDVLDIRVLVGVELTHVPPQKIGPLAILARKRVGARLGSKAPREMLNSLERRGFILRTQKLQTGGAAAKSRLQATRPHANSSCAPAI